MADVSIRAAAVAAVPRDYTIPGAQELLPKMVSATMDGTSAASSWFPCLEIVDPGGNVMGTNIATSSIAAGASADVSWFPKLRPETAVGPSPNPLGTLWAWYDFSDSTTLTFDGSSKIEAITDKTGNGHNLSQPTASKRPGTATVNGLQAGFFTHTAAQWLIGGPFSDRLLQPFTILCVFTQDIAASAGYWPGPYNGHSTVSGANLFMNDSNTRLVMEMGVGSIQTPFSAPFTQQQTTAIYNGGSSTLRVNGAVANTGTVDANYQDTVVLGAQQVPNSDPDDNLQGKIGEALYYTTALTSPQLTAVESYLRTKWGTP